MLESPFFAISYARANVEDSDHRSAMVNFVEKLSSEVAQELGRQRKDGVCFVDYDNLQVGHLWDDSLATALRESRVGVALYSPSYFTSEWCGREFQVFLDRCGKKGEHQSGIIPVLWRQTANIHEKALPLQYVDGAFPPSYGELGMLSLASLASERDAYIKTVNTLAKRIVAAANPGLSDLKDLDLGKIQSAWKQPPTPTPGSHKKGSVSKTCFVYLSRDGWQWEPYAQQEPVGATAQRVAADIGVQYQELDCDADLMQKLEETYENDVPAILIGDPASITDPLIANALKKYDRILLSNCATIFAWPSDAKGNNDPIGWSLLETQLCPQKIAAAPPHHEWRTIFSTEDLNARTRTLLETIRMQLIQKILSRQAPDGTANGTVLRAESKELTDKAASKGISVATAPQIGPAA